MICVTPQSDLSKVRSHSSCDRFTHPLNGDCIRAKYAGREKKATLAQYEDANGIHRHVRSDTAIVLSPKARYVIAIYTRQVEDTRWGVDNKE